MVFLIIKFRHILLVKIRTYVYVIHSMYVCIYIYINIYIHIY